MSQLLNEKAADVVRSIRDFVRRATTPLNSRLSDLEQRVLYLEVSQTKGLTYEGVWRQDTRPERGQFYTHDGSLWHCNEATNDRPGGGSNAWTLAVKRGADSRSAR